MTGNTSLRTQHTDRQTLSFCDPTGTHLWEGIHTSALLVVVSPFPLIFGTLRVAVGPQPLLVPALPLTIVHTTVLMLIVLWVGSLTC